MTKDKLIKAKELDFKIETIKDEIKKWNTATSFDGSQLTLKSKTSSLQIDISYIGFDVLKGLCLSQLKDKLDHLVKDFNKL